MGTLSSPSYAAVSVDKRVETEVVGIAATPPSDSGCTGNVTTSVVVSVAGNGHGELWLIRTSVETIATGTLPPSPLSVALSVVKRVDAESVGIAGTLPSDSECTGNVTSPVVVSVASNGPGEPWLTGTAAETVAMGTLPPSPLSVALSVAKRGDVESVGIAGTLSSDSECTGNVTSSVVISLAGDVVEQSSKKWPPRRWQSSLTITSQSPSSSTSKLRCRSGSRLMRT